MLGTRAEEMARGQAERLLPLLEELLGAHGKVWSDLAAIGVGTGPGNFTGIRIAVSAARGLALGLGIPAVGISGCEARALLIPDTALAAIPAPRDQVYLCAPADAAAIPQLMPRIDAQNAAAQMGRRLHAENSAEELAGAIARLAAGRWRTVTGPPAPLYARAADAAPSRDLPPVLLD